MKSAERLRKLRDMSIEELQRNESEMGEQLFKLRFQWAMGQTETLKKMRDLRRDKARVKTIIREKEAEV
jgi:large subunit ribosomal protein L29